MFGAPTLRRVTSGVKKLCIERRPCPRPDRRGQCHRHYTEVSQHRIRQRACAASGAQQIKLREVSEVLTGLLMACNHIPSIFGVSQSCLAGSSTAADNVHGALAPGYLSN